MLQDFQNTIMFPVSIAQVVGTITVALVCGLLASVFYRLTYKGAGYSMSFVHSIIALAMIAAVAVMVIGNNLARAFGLVGTMSIIRFRTAVKDTQDIVFIFFSLVAGMAAGVGLNLVALTGTLFIGAVMLVLSKSGYASPRKREFVLQFSFESPGDAGNEDPAYVPVMGRYCKRSRVLSMKSVGEGDLLELSYYVNLKNKDKSKDFIRDLRRVQGVDRVNLFFDDE